MEEISCIFCQQNENAVVLKENGYQGKKCSSCALIYISPRPTSAEVSDLYGHSNARISPHSHIQGDFLKRLYARHILNMIKRYKKNGTLLEIGAGGGYFLDEARKKGFTPYGIELNPIQETFITQKLGIACEQKALSMNSFGDRVFDIIYHSDVISHFHDPITEFKTMHAKLKPGGLLIFETGNIADIKPAYFSLFRSFQYPDHLFFFGEKTLEQLLGITNFSIEKIKRYSIVPQLTVMNMVQRSSVASAAAPSKPSLLHDNRSGKTLLLFVKKWYHFLLYLLRYHIGALVPKKERPQTVIIIATK